MTSGGGNIIGCEFNRNEQSARWAVATIEVAGEHTMTACGGNLIGCEFNRNEQSARWAVATIEDGSFNLGFNAGWH